ncbi:hypothetical protein [Serratia entomophila]
MPIGIMEFSARGYFLYYSSAGGGYFFFFTTFHSPPADVSLKAILNLLLFQWVKPNNRRALRLLFALIMMSLLWLAKVDAAPRSRKVPDAFI